MALTGALVISMGCTAVGGIILEKVLYAFGQTEYAQYIKVGTTCVVGGQAVAAAMSLVSVARKVISQ